MSGTIDNLDSRALARREQHSEAARVSKRAPAWRGRHSARLRGATLAAGAALVASLDGLPADAHLLELGRGLERLVHTALPATTRLKPPEGYTHYGAHPMSFVSAARDYRREVGPARGSRAIVVGIRSIGTSLSAAVAAAIQQWPFCDRAAAR